MVKNKSLYNHLVELTQLVLPLIKPAVDKSFLPRELDNYPNLWYTENGMPNVSTFSSKVDISQFFNPLGNSPPKIDLDHFPQFDRALKYARATPEIVSYHAENIQRELTREQIDDREKFRCRNFLIDIVERYYYRFGDTFNEEKFNEVYLPVEKFLYSQKLYFNISVPILFIQFDTDYFEIGPNVAIRRIGDESHRSRHRIASYSSSILSSVLMSATHELLLKNFICDRPSTWQESAFTQPNAYPLQLIETFFTLLKITTDQTSGFAQLLIYPDDWVDYYIHDLEPIYGTSLRAYPTYFDDYFWIKKSFPCITPSELKQLAELNFKVLESKENKLTLALKRFYRSTLRQDEEDIILDLIIAFEVLLGDSEKSEITHKLALRIAALLSKHFPDTYNAVTVFESVKKIYNYRSVIVHGSSNNAKKREILIHENTSVPIVDLAREYLRNILKIVITEPKYLNSKENDRLLLLPHG